MLDDSALLINSNEVVILVLPDHLPRTDLIARSALLQLTLLGYGPFCILEADLPVLRDGSVDLIYVVVDILICILHTVLYDHLPLQILGLVNTGKTLKLLDKLTGFACGKKSGGLDCINKQFQLCNLKLTAGKLKPRRSFPAIHNIHTEHAQSLNIIVYGLAFCMNSEILQISNQVLHTHGMGFVCLLRKHPHEI